MAITITSYNNMTYYTANTLVVICGLINLSCTLTFQAYIFIVQPVHYSVE